MASSKSVKLVIGSVVLVILAGLIAAAGYVILRMKNREDQVVREREAEADRIRDIKAAFERDPGPLEEDVPTELREFFEQFVADKTRDVASNWDFDRMFIEFGIGTPKDRAGRAVMVQAREQLRKAMDHTKADLDFDSFEIRGVRWIDKDRDAVVAVRQTKNRGADNEVVSKFRWWMYKSAAGWRLYDFEDIQSPGRYCDLMGVVFRQEIDPKTRGQLGNIEFEVAAFREANQLWVEGDLEKALGKLDLVTFKGLPAELRSSVPAARGLILVELNKHDAALEELQRADRIQPGTPNVDLGRCRAYGAKQEHAKTIENGRRFVEKVGFDAEVNSRVGIALFELKKFAEATTEFEKALKDNPDDFNAFQWLISAVIDDPAQADRTALAQAFAKLKSPEKSFVRHLRFALDKNDLTAGEVLLRAMEKREPGSSVVAEGKMHLHLHRGEIESWAKSLQAHLDKTSNKEERQRALTVQVSLMMRRGKVSSDFSHVPAELQNQLFCAIADQMPLGDGDEDSTEFFPSASGYQAYLSFINDRQKACPDDPSLLLHRGRLAESVGKIDRALALYNAGAIRCDVPELATRYRDARLWALVRTDRVLEAYREVAPDPEGFHYTAQQLQDRPADLEKLIQWHRAKHPGDNEINWHVSTVAQSRSDWPKVIESCREYIRRLEAILPAERRNGFPFILNNARDRLVRALIRTKNFIEARREIATLREMKFWNANRLVAILYGATGDFQRLSSELGREGNHKHVANAFYHDPDLAELLRSDRYRALRSLYPEPTEELPVPRLVQK